MLHNTPYIIMQTGEPSDLVILPFLISANNPSSSIHTTTKYANIFKFYKKWILQLKNSFPAPTRGLQSDFWSIHTFTEYSITWIQSHRDIESARDLGLYIFI